MLALLFGVFISASSATLVESHVPVSTAPDSTRKAARQRETVQDSAAYYVHINRIFVLGNKQTRENIILRELTLKPGDSILNHELPKVLEKDERKIFNLALFHTVEMQPLELQPGRADLLVEVQERWYTFPVPIFQLSDRNFNEWWETYNHDLSRVYYGLKLYRYNMRGRNETLTFTAQFGFVQRFEFMYRIPYLDKRQKQGLIFQADYIDAKNVAYQTRDHKLAFLETDRVQRNTNGLGLVYTYRNTFYNHHRLGYSFRNTSISDSLARSNANYLGEDKVRQEYDVLSYEFISDYRDVVAYPLNGYNFLFHIQKVGFALSNDIEKLDVWASYARYMNLKNNFYLSNYSFGYWSNKNNIPYYNYGAMGYNKLLVRGYELNVIEGPWYFLNKTTLKKRIFSRTYSLEGSNLRKFKYLPVSIYVKTYGDFGYVSNYAAYENTLPPINSSLSNKLIAGTGFGVDIVSSYDTVMRVEYSFNAEGDSGFFFHIKKEF